MSLCESLLLRHMTITMNDSYTIFSRKIELHHFLEPGLSPTRGAAIFELKFNTQAGRLELFIAKKARP